MTYNEIFKAINAVSNKVNHVSQQLDAFTLQKHKENKDIIDENESGMVEIAEMASNGDDALAEIADLINEQSEAICELAEVVTNLIEKQ
jgi:methyl-accepting chemotaxis protein